MFARKLSIHLKPNAAADLARIIGAEVIPLLRKQGGFQDELAFITKSGGDAFTVSLWDREEDAEAYDRHAYRQVRKMLEAVVEGVPLVETYAVSNSTFHRIVTPATDRPGSRQAGYPPGRKGT